MLGLKPKKKDDKGADGDKGTRQRVLQKAKGGGEGIPLIIALGKEDKDWHAYVPLKADHRGKPPKDFFELIARQNLFDRGKSMYGVLSGEQLTIDPSSKFVASNNVKKAIKADMKPPYKKIKIIKPDGSSEEIDSDAPDDQASETGSQETVAATSDQSDQVVPAAEERWKKRSPAIKEAAAKAIKQGQGDTQKVQALWSAAAKLAGAEDFEKATEALARLETLLRTIMAEGGSPTPQSDDKITKSKEVWASTRTLMENEMVKLQKAILDAERNDENNTDVDLQAVEQSVAQLTSYLDPFNGDFGKAIAVAENTDDPAKRKQAVKVSLDVLTKYEQTLSSDFFQSVDSNEYLPVKVAGPAQKSIDQIRKWLS